MLLLGLTGCAAGSGSMGQERILVWHSWPEAEAAGLQAVIDDFTSLNPEARVIVTGITSADPEAGQWDFRRSGQPHNILFRRYVEQAELGLGPDVLIGPSVWVRPLADAGLIQNLSNRILDTSSHLSTAIDTLRYQPENRPSPGLYGLPLTLENGVLFFNTDMVAEPPGTLDNLLIQARSGQKLALNSRFDPAFWGVQAFGGQLFDAEGRVMLDQGGFANWLIWLKAAQTEANVILEDHQGTLETLFKEGEVAFLVAEISTLPALQEALGADGVGVAPLPRGPSQPAGPFLRTRAAMLNSHSSPAQSDLALKLVQFLAQPAQQTNLMRQTGLVPSNNQVRVEWKVYPNVAAALAQAKTAVPYLNLPQMDAVQKYGDDVYLQTLTGAVEPSEAARIFSSQINEMYGFEPAVVQAEDECDLAGELELWHRWPNTPAGDALQLLVADFSRRCPGVNITLTAFNSDDLFEQYRAASGQSDGPDMVLAPSSWVVTWANQELVADLTGLIKPETLQQYNSIAIRSLQFNRGLYGMPLWLNLMALYYRANQVTDPPGFVDDLLNRASPEQAVLLPVDAAHSAWAGFAFGALVYDDAQKLQLDPAGTVAWLEWMQEAHATPGVTLSLDSNELKQIFKSARASYYAGEAMELAELQLALGSTVLRVSPLPAGPAGEARPQLITEGLMLNPAALSDADHAALVVAFGAFLSGQAGQNLLMQRASLVPSHINVDTTEYPAVSGFLQQVETADLWRLDSVIADVAVNEQAGEILNEMVERAVFNGEDAATVVGSTLEELQSLEETSP
ncbi:MAG: hypothetical protein Kow0031_33840 [Anaerolineae bacterium]